MFYRLRTYRIILQLKAAFGEFLVFDHFQDGKIEETSRQFLELRDLARERLCAIKQFPGTNVFAHLKRHVALSKLNAMLSFYGWAIKRDGTMIEIRVRGEPVDLNLLEHDSLRYGSFEDVNEWARRLSVVRVFGTNGCLN